MLAPHSRSLLFDLLRPPEGYRFDAAVGATYSLDLLAMLVTPLAFTLFDWEAKDGRIVASPFALLESLRRHADRIVLFCQAGEIQVPSRHRRLFGYLERSVVEVRVPTKAAVFHPKLWMLRMVPADREPDSDWPVLYRLLCPSRNLTFERSWDTVLSLEGPYQPRGRRNHANESLARFVTRLPELAVRELPPDAARTSQRMAEELRHVSFEPPESFDEVRFWPLGLDGTHPWPFPEEMDRLLVISPFVSDQLLRRLSPRGRTATVVSRADELVKLDQDTLDRFDPVLTLNPAAQADQGGNQEVEESAVAAAEPPAEGGEDLEVDMAAEGLSGLHAKLYVADLHDRGHVWTGSANATDAAFGRNVELLVELLGPLEECGVDALLDPDEGRSFGALLQLYAPPKELHVDEVEEELQGRLDELQRMVAGHGLHAAVAPRENGELFDLSVIAETPLPKDWRAGYPVVCRPVTVPEHWRQRLGGESPTALFSRLALEGITSFFVFSVEAEVKGRRGRRQFVVNLSLDGEPPDRRERLLFSLLRNSDQVMRYLLLLLADDGWDARHAIEILDEHDRRARQSEEAGQASADLPLLEALLRALTKDSVKLDRIAELIADLSRTAEGQSLIPAGFDDVWQPIWQARKGVR